MEERELTIPMPDDTAIKLMFTKADGDIHWTCTASAEFLFDAQALINRATMKNHERR